jgi:hypothetical protein
MAAAGTRPKHRIAPADRGRAIEDVRETAVLGASLHRGARIGDGHELPPGLVLALHCRHLVEEVVGEDVGLERRPGLGLDDEQGRLQRDGVPGRLHLRRIGRIQHMESRPAAQPAEGLAQHLGPKAGAAHAHQDDVGDAVTLHLVGEILQGVRVLQLVVDDRQPAQPLILVRRGPQRLVAGPQAADPSLPAPDLGLGRKRRLRLIPAGFDPLAAIGSAKGPVTASGDGSEQRVEGVCELLNAVYDQVAGDLLQGDADVRYRLQRSSCAGYIPLDGVGFGHAVVAERVHGGRRNGVHRVASDQRFDIERVLEGRVLGRGRRPEEALGPGAGVRQRLPARARKQGLIARIGDLGIGDRRLAAEPRRRRLVLCRVELFVHGRVDAAHEEAGHAGHLGQVAALGLQRLQALQIGLHHLLVGVDGEQERDVDVHPFADQALDGGDAGRRRGDLHHQVWPVDGFPQVQRLLHRRFGVVGEIGRAFQAHIAVAALGLGVDGLQDVGRRLDVGDGQMLIDLRQTAVAFCQEGPDRVRIVAAVANRLLEDRGVRRQTLQPILFDHPLQFAALDQAPLEIVEPGRLAARLELLQRVRRGHRPVSLGVCDLICARAASTTLSGAKPNFLNRSLIGADAPKLCMPITAPSLPA